MAPWDDPKHSANTPSPFSLKEKLSHSTRMKIAFGVLCLATVSILYTGPGFNFALQVVLTFVLLVFLFWLVT